MEKTYRSMDKLRLAGYGIILTSVGGIMYAIYPLFASNPVASVMLCATGVLYGLRLISK